MSELTINSKAASVVFQNVTKTYGKTVVAVDDISLEIQPGMLTTLLGPSGCGKTTTLRLIAGLEIATRGRIYIGNDDVTNFPATDRDVSMVFQSYALFPHMSVIDNVSYGLRYSGFGKEEARSRADDGLELVGLAGLADRLPSEISGGQQQRVAVARALVLEPQVLLFDEPLSNLDAKLRRRVRDEIRDIQQHLRLTVVYVTHDQEEALAVSDRIIVMRNASIAQDGTPRDLYEVPADRFVADFIGEANLISCIVTAVDNETATIRIGDYVHRLPARNLREGPATVAVRPGRLQLSATATKDSLDAEIRKATYVGSRMEYTVATSFGTLFAVLDDVESPFAIGQSVALRFADSGPVLLPES